MKRLVCLSALAVSLAALAQQQPVSEKGKAVQGVNWEGQVLKATGSGAPDLRASTPAQARLGATRAAKLDALRNLLEQAKGIQITAGKTVGDDKQVLGKVEGVIRGFKITDTRYYSDNGVEVDVEVPLAAIAGAVIPEPEKQLAVKTKGEGDCSGLVVDATGLKVVPALAPRIFDTNGTEIYGAGALTPEARQARGVASYFRNLHDENLTDLVGKKPLVVKASGVSGSDVMISPDDLKKLAALNQSFLAEGRVAIVFK